MSTLSELAERHTNLSAEDIEWLHLLHAEGQLTADLALADIVLWLPTVDGGFVAGALFRPSSANTLFYRDIVGNTIPPEWVMLMSECVRRGVIVDTTEPIWFEETATKIRAVPVRRGDSSSLVPIAVLSRHINLAEARQQTSRQATTFVSSAEELFNMISEGAFPDSGAPAGPKLGAPRASDGLMRLDVDGVVQFASPNALSALHRFGYINEIEGASLTAIAETVQSEFTFDEVIGIFAPMGDKDVRGILLELEQVMDSIIVTANSSPRGMKVTELEKMAAEIFGSDRTFSTPTLTEAIDKAVKDCIRPLSDETIGILITGSVVSVGESRTIIRKKFAKETF